MSKLQVLAYANGKLTQMDGRVQDVTISGDINTCFRACAVTLNNATTLRKRDLTFKLGQELRVLWDGKVIFKGVMFKQSVDTSGNQSLSAYDYNVYLVKNSDSVTYKNKTATAITKELCAKFGIATGNIADTQHVINKFTVGGKTVFDIITVALTLTFRATGRKYRLISDGGKLSLIDVKKPTKAIVIENESNLMSASYSESIEDLKSKVKLTGGEEKKPITVTESNATAAKEYGTMQHYEHMSDVKKESELRTLAKSLLAEMSVPAREFNVDAIGDNEVKSGVALAVNDSMTGIEGTFFVASDSHTYSADGTHTMTLKLSRTQDVPQAEADKEPKPPKPKKPKKKKKDVKADDKEAKK